MTKQRHLSDWLMFLALVIFWGSSFALTKIAVVSISPLWVMVLRLVLAAVILTAMMRLQGLSLPRDPNALLWYMALGGIGSVLPFFLIGWGSLYLASGLVGIMMALVPLVTLVLAHFLLPDERLNLTRSLGFLVGFAGLIILLGPHLLGEFSFEGSLFLAQIAIVLATSCYALLTVIARKAPSMSTIQKSTGSMIAAALMGLLLALVVEPFGLQIASISSYAATLALGIFPTALAALLLFSLIDRTGTSFVPLSNYLVAPFAYFLGIFSLNEPFEYRALIGLLVILVGIYISERGQTSR